MKTTRIKLKTIVDKNNCEEFNAEIYDLLRKNYLVSDNEEFDIPQSSLNKIVRCSPNQLNLLTSIDIVSNPTWNRWDKNKSNIYYFLDRSIAYCFEIKQGTSTIANKHFSFQTKEEAENESHIIKTMMLMRSWVKHYNEIDNFKWNWEEHSKYGIVFEKTSYSIDNWTNLNVFIFGLVVSSRERALELLKEFEQDLLKIKW